MAITEFTLQNGQRITPGVYILHLPSGDQYWVVWSGAFRADCRGAMEPEFIALRDTPAGETGPIALVEKVI